jgi:hypothetical protein
MKKRALAVDFAVILLILVGLIVAVGLGYLILSGKLASYFNQAINFFRFGI